MRKNEIIARAAGTTFLEISKSTFREMDILVPSKLLLERFQDFAADIIEQIRLIKSQIDKLRQARDILLPKLMNGELEV
jgi:type I restriction enzyme, S subunit